MIIGSTTELNKGKISLPRKDRVKQSEKAFTYQCAGIDHYPPAETTNATTVKTVKDKSKKFLKLTSRGFSVVIPNLSSEAKAKELLSELCNNPAFDNNPQFRTRCEDFLPKLFSGVNTYKKNYDQLQF